jgi:hypothetical protein
MPGVRDQHSGCVSAYMVEHDLFDFLLLSLPDNDWHSHKRGPEGQLRSLALADAQLARTMEAGGGVEEFLEHHAVIVMADHSQAPVHDTVDLRAALTELDVLAPGAREAEARRAQIAVCPSQRAAMVYLLGERRRTELRSDVVRRVLALDGVELVLWLERDAAGEPREGVIARPSLGELRFCPGGELRDGRGGVWSVEGELGVLAAARVQDGLLVTPEHPDALARAWVALVCPTSGDVLLSAAPGHEFLDWGGQAHIGGGSHGSLRGEDSLGALVLCGLERGSGAPGRSSSGEQAAQQWSICDAAPLVLAHFGIR